LGGVVPRPAGDGGARRLSRLVDVVIEARNEHLARLEILQVVEHPAEHVDRLVEHPAPFARVLVPRGAGDGDLHREDPPEGERHGRMVAIREVGVGDHEDVAGELVLVLGQLHGHGFRVVLLVRLDDELHVTGSSPPPLSAASTPTIWA
jgi:hypothetical protein